MCATPPPRLPLARRTSRSLIFFSASRIRFSMSGSRPFCGIAAVGVHSSKSWRHSPRMNLRDRSVNSLLPACPFLAVGRSSIRGTNKNNFHAASGRRLCACSAIMNVPERRLPDCRYMLRHLILQIEIFQCLPSGRLRRHSREARCTAGSTCVVFEPVALPPPRSFLCILWGAVLVVPAEESRTRYPLQKPSPLLWLLPHFAPAAVLFHP